MYVQWEINQTCQLLRAVEIQGSSGNFFKKLFWSLFSKLKIILKFKDVCVCFVGPFECVPTICFGLAIQTLKISLMTSETLWLLILKIGQGHNSWSITTKVWQCCLCTNTGYVNFFSPPALQIYQILTSVYHNYTGHKTYPQNGLPSAAQVFESGSSAWNFPPKLVYWISKERGFKKSRGRRWTRNLKDVF